MLIGQLVLLLLCAVSIAGFGWLWLRAVRRTEVRSDLQRQIYLARRSFKAAFVAGMILGAACTVVIGLAGVGSGLFAGWGLVAMAILPLEFLALYVYLAKLPFTYSDDL